MAYNVIIGTSDQYLYEITISAYCKKQAIDEGIRQVKRYYNDCDLIAPAIVKAEAHPQGFRVL